jgi:hypothetical protein
MACANAARYRTELKQQYVASTSGGSAGSSSGSNAKPIEKQRAPRGLTVDLVRRRSQPAPLPADSGASDGSSSGAVHSSAVHAQLPRPTIVGDADRFQVTSQAGFSVQVERQGTAYVLRLF